MREVHGWRRVRRWLGATALGIVGFVVLAVLGVIFVMQTHWGRELVRKQVQAKLESTFVGGATIGSIEGTPFTDIVLKNLVINGPDRKPAIEVGVVHLKAGLLPLISHQLVLEKIVADNVDVRLDRDANGELRIKHLTKPGPPSTWNVLLPKVEVSHAHVLFDTGKEVMDLDDISIVANAKIPHGGPLDAGAIVHASWRQRGAPIDIAAVIHNDKLETRVPTAIVRVADVVVAANAVRIPRQGPIAGAVAANVPAATLDRLLPQLNVPLDVVLDVQATPSGHETQVALGGTLGGAPVQAYVHADLAEKTVAGFLDVSGLDLFAATTGAVDGIAKAHAVFDYAPPIAGQELPRAHAVVQATSEKGDVPRIDALASLTAEGDLLRATIGATGAAGLKANVDVVARKHGDAIALEKATLDASTNDPAAATGGKAQVHGALDAHLVASGDLKPHADLAIEGHVDGKQIHRKDLSASSLALRIDAKHVPQQPIGSARVEVNDLVRGNLELGKLTVAAGNRPDKKIQVSVRSQPKRAPWLVDLDALVTPGETVRVDLQRHFVRAAGGATWRGNTGEIAIGPQKIEIRDLKSTSAQGNLALAGDYVRAGAGAGDLHAKLDGSFDLSNLEKGRTGHVDAAIDVTRRAQRWDGKVDMNAKGFSIAQIEFDANAKIRAQSGKVTAAVEANSVRAGHGTLALDVAAPTNLANAAAWGQLTKRAIRDLDIKLDHVDLRAVQKLAHTKPLQGMVDGEIKLANGVASGTIRARGVQGDAVHDLGTIDADVALEQIAHDEIRTTVDTNISKIGKISANVLAATPNRVFDPAAWKRLGPNALQGASLKTSELAFEPGTLEKAGIASLLRGRAQIAADIGPALRDAKVTVDVRDLHGGVITMPVTAHLEAAIGQKLTAALGIRGNNMEIVKANVESPLALAQLRANPKAVKTAALRATIEIPHVQARQLMAVLGNTQVAGGTIDGKIEVAGTVGKPTAKALITAQGVTVPPGEGGKPVPFVQQFRLDATWDGATGKVAIAAAEANGGNLHITAGGRPDVPAEISANVQASKLDLAPLVAFMPGPAGGLGGRLDANLTLRGIDPKTAQLGGTLHVSEGRIPIAPAIGTLFHGDVGVNVQNRMATIAATGKLGRGDVKLFGSAPLDPNSSAGGEVKIDVHHVQLIGTTEPIIDSHIDARLARANDAWHATVAIQNTSVHIPDEKGQKLAPVGAPPDIVYGGPAHHTPPTQVEGTPPHRAPPSSPVLVADIRLDNAKVEAKELRGNVSGRLHITVGGKEVGIVGNVWLGHGDLDLFDRRYAVDRAAVHFDGSLDPVLDIRITHDFPDVTTITEIHGRASKPELDLSSSPALYSRAELLGFLLGGEPGGDPNDAPSAAQRVAQAGESYLANKVGGYIKDALPVDIDVLRYESATSTTSAAVTVGTWLTHELFLAWREHLEARPDENAGEGEIEYWLRQRLVLQGTVGDRGYDGVDLLWRRRW